MNKQKLSLVILAVLLSLSACQSTEGRVGSFLSDLSCLNASNNGNMSLEETDQVLLENGFASDLDLSDAVDRLSKAELEAQITLAIAKSETVCSSEIAAAKIDNEDFIKEHVSDIIKTGSFLGEIACLTARTNGQMTEEEIAQLGSENGFSNESELASTIHDLSSEELKNKKKIALNHINSTCLSNFDSAEASPNDFLDDFLNTVLSVQTKKILPVEEAIELEQ